MTAAGNTTTRLLGMHLITFLKFLFYVYTHTHTHTHTHARVHACARPLSPSLSYHSFYSENQATGLILGHFRFYVQSLKHGTLSNGLNLEIFRAE